MSVDSRQLESRPSQLFSGREATVNGDSIRRHKAATPSSTFATASSPRASADFTFNFKLSTVDLFSFSSRG